MMMMMMRASVAVLVLACVALAEPALPQCCKDLDGVDLPVPCTCLSDDATVFDQSVEAGSYKYYHWVMTNWAIINVPDADRPEMTVELAPCDGDAHLYIQGPSLQANPFPSVDATLWNASASYQPNTITFGLTAAQYFITVYGAEDSSFSIAAQISGPQIVGSKFPTPGGNGTVVALPQATDKLILKDDPIGMDITIMTAEAVHGDEEEYEYRLYQVPVIVGQPCGDDNITNAPDCILSSFCGAEARMAPVGDWQKFTPGTNVTLATNTLTQNQEYTFTVAVRSPSGNVAMYTGTRGTPTYERVGQAASDNTILIISLVVVGVFIALVLGIVYFKVKLNKEFQERRIKRQQYKAIAPDGKSAAKGRGARGTEEKKAAPGSEVKPSM